MTTLFIAIALAGMVTLPGARAEATPRPAMEWIGPACGAALNKSAATGSGCHAVHREKAEGRKVK